MTQFYLFYTGQSTITVFWGRAVLSTCPLQEMRVQHTHSPKHQEKSTIELVYRLKCELLFASIGFAILVDNFAKCSLGILKIRIALPSSECHDSGIIHTI